MVTYRTEKVVDLYGLSGDTKPVDDITIANGSKFFEMDTKKVYIFDEENKVWLDWKE